MKDVGIIAISLGDVVGPLQPYEDEEEVKARSEGLIMTVDVDVQLDLRSDPSAAEDSSQIIVLEEVAEVPLPPHAYTKVGNIRS